MLRFESPFFVLCSPRSGSTLLRYILDSHPEVCAPPEMYVADLIGPAHKLLFLTTASEAVTQTKDRKEREALAYAQLRALVCEHVAALLSAKGKRIWCEKSPAATVLESEAILSVFPDARFISLHRHCLDFVHSALEFSRYGFSLRGMADFVRAYPHSLVDALVRYWIMLTTKQLALEKERPSFRIRYESLVQAPRDVLAKLVEFLGVPWDERMLEAVFASNHDDVARGGDHKIFFTKEIHTDSVGLGGTIPYELISDEARGHMNELLRALDYEEVGPTWNARAAAKAMAAPTTSETAAEGGPAALFEREIPSRLRERPGARELKASCKFVLDDREDTTWIVDLTGSEPRVVRESRDATCTLFLASSTFNDIVAKRVNPVSAFQKGQIRLLGDSRIAGLFYQLLFG